MTRGPPLKSVQLYQEKKKRNDEKKESALAEEDGEGNGRRRFVGEITTRYARNFYRTFKGPWIMQADVRNN